MTTFSHNEPFHLDSLIALPFDRAAKLAGISAWRLNHWDSTNVVVASIRRRVGRFRPIRLYTFADLEGLLVAAQLRRKVPLQQIRRVVDHLKSRGYERPLSELRFAIVAGEIHFQHPDGTWEGDKAPDQTVMIEVIVIYMEEIRSIIRKGIGRPEDAEGRIERKRGRQGRRPVFASTRIPVETVTRRLALGHTSRQIMESYPDLTEKDIAKARELASV